MSYFPDKQVVARQVRADKAATAAFLLGLLAALAAIVWTVAA
jgi:hypothetical protein